MSVPAAEDATSLVTPSAGQPGNTCPITTSFALVAQACSASSYDWWQSAHTMDSDGISIGPSLKGLSGGDYRGDTLRSA